MNVMTARKLLAVSVGALAMTAAAQSIAPPSDLPPPDGTGDVIQSGAPLGIAPAPTVGPDLRIAPNPTDLMVTTPAFGNAPAQDVYGYARDKSQMDAQCLKLSGTALDECLKGADHGQ